MPVKVFIDDEAGYQQWLRNHPKGFVVTTVRDISANYMSLHQATCRMISKYMKNMSSDAFTGKGYIKACSLSTCDLLQWIADNGGTGFTKICSICAPTPEDCDEAVTNFEKYLADLTKAVSDSLNDPETRKKRLSTASAFPSTISVTTTVYRRNPDVIAEVLCQANGKCAECGEPAPFNRSTDGSPYLEVHHRVPLSEGGLDTVENARALCPNCHRKAHYGN